MNIFILDYDIETCARYHVDKWVVKMPLEYAQLLCTARHVLNDNPINIPYKITHKNHPCSIWTRHSLENYNWLCKLGLAVCREYTFRYEKIHKCQKIIENCIEYLPQFDYISRSRFALAMPDDCKLEDVVQSYRLYVNKYKKHLLSWKNRERPNWIIDI